MPLKLLVPSVKVSIAGEDRPLSFGVAAHIAFFEATGRDLNAVLRDVGLELQAAQRENREARSLDVFPMRLQIAMLYAGLIADTLDEHGNPTDRTLSIRDLMSVFPTVESIVPAIVKAGQVLNKALEDAYSLNPPEAPSTQKKARRTRAGKSTGEDSGALQASASA